MAAPLRPAVTVADELGVPRSTATRHITTARRCGLLTAPAPAGGTVTEQRLSDRALAAHPADWYCRAKRRPERGDTLCELRAGFGTNHGGAGHCKFHGGNTRTQVAASLEELAQARFRRWVAEHGGTSSDDPLTTILEVLAEVRDWHRFVRALVDDIDAGEWESRGKDGATQLTVYVSLLERAQERAYRVASDIVRLGIEDRLARVTELQGRAIAAVLLGALDDLGLGERAEEASAAVSRRLELVVAGKAGA